MYLFSNILGVFAFDDLFELADEILFRNLEEYQNRGIFIEKMAQKHKNLKQPDENGIKNILGFFKNKKFLSDFYSQNLLLTKQYVKNSVDSSLFIIHAVKTVDELDKAINLIANRLREWYDLYNPEFSRSVQSHELFVEGILDKERNELLKLLSIEEKDTLGADLKQEDLEPIKSLTHQIYDLYQLRKLQMNYISNLMDEYCPNLKAVCDVLVGAKLIEHAGSLKRLSEMPASTIQILGAEKALFRHMKTGSKPPRHGVIAEHPLIANAPEKLHGKIARTLADKICIAAKVDYFHGKFVGENLKKELEGKFGKTF